MKNKKFLTVFLCLVLSFVLVFALVACGPDEPEGPTYDNVKSQAYINEVATAMSKSIDANFATGFNIALSGSVSSGDTYTFDISGNVIPGKDDDNKSFRIAIKDNNGEVVFGLYNAADNLYINAGDVKLNIKDANIMQLVRYILTASGVELEGNLKDIEIMDATLADQMKIVVPMIFGVLSRDPAITDVNKNMIVTKEGNVVTIKVFLDNLVNAVAGLVQDIDLSFIPAGITADVKIDITGGYFKGISVVAADDFSLNIKSENNGLFGAVKQNFDAQVPADLKAVEESSMIQTDIAGKINFNNAEGVVRSYDWKLLAKIDLFTLIENNFMLEKLPADNFFHFQLSHTCDDNCAEFCKNNMFSAHNVNFTDRYAHTSIIDIAYDAEDFGANNIHAEIGLFDLFTTAGIETLISKVAGLGLSQSGQLVNMMLSSQLVLNIDTYALTKSDTTIVPKPAEAGIDTVAAAGEVSISNILANVFYIFSDGNLNLPKLTAALEVALGKGNIADGVNLTIDDIISCALGMPKYVSGNSGAIENQVTNITASVDSVKLFADAKVGDYNTFEKAAKYNINYTAEDGTLVENPLRAGESNIYQGTNLQEEIVGGSPAAKVVGIEQDADGFAVLYERKETVIDPGWPPFMPPTIEVSMEKATDGATAISAADWIEKYDCGKKLFFKYKYIDYNGEEKELYANPFGFDGLDLTKSGVQEVTLLANMLNGDSFANVLDTNLGGLLTMLGITGISLPNIDSILGIPCAQFETKVNIGA